MTKTATYERFTCSSFSLLKIRIWICSFRISIFDIRIFKRPPSPRIGRTSPGPPPEVKGLVRTNVTSDGTSHREGLYGPDTQILDPVADGLVADPQEAGGPLPIPPNRIEGIENRLSLDF